MPTIDPTLAQILDFLYAKVQEAGAANQKIAELEQQLEALRPKAEADAPTPLAQKRGGG